MVCFRVNSGKFKDGKNSREPLKVRDRHVVASSWTPFARL